MSMSDHIKQQVVGEFFAKQVSFSWKTAKLDSFVSRSGRSSKHIEICYIFLSRGSVAHCFKLLHDVRYRTAERIASNR